jgi:hypothetical protein
MARIRARTIAREIARRLDVEDGDMIVIKKTSDITDSVRMFEALRNAFGAIGKEKVILAVVDDHDDIRLLKEKEMLSYGWCRCADDISGEA